MATSAEATSEVFFTAFRSLPKKAREAVLQKMLNDKALMEDLLDAVVIRQRRAEPSRDLDEYLSKRDKKRKSA